MLHLPLNLVLEVSREDIVRDDKPVESGSGCDEAERDQLRHPTQPA